MQDRACDGDIQLGEEKQRIRPHTERWTKGEAEDGEEERNTIQLEMLDNEASWASSWKEVEQRELKS